MTKKYYYLFAVCVFSICLSVMNSVSSSGIYHFKSPQNSFLVKFIELEHYKSTGSTDMDDISNVKYTIYFYKNADSLIAQTDYADVYGWRKGDLPTEPKVIFKALTWSPREDFVILPEEGWASAPGPPNLKVVNLNTQYSWNETRIYMDISHWVDVYRIIGDSYNDCYFTVAMFDGKIGKMSEIIKSKSPIGYKISSFKNGILVLENLLDNCLTEEDEKNFLMNV